MKMIKIKDDCIEADELFGPIPNFNDSFESYFTRKAAELVIMTETSLVNNNNYEMISLTESRKLNDFNWMYDVPLAKNSREQNVEIIYNNKLVYFKVVRTITKSDALFVFPSKDLEIALGLQYIPFTGEGHYRCRKCTEILSEQFCLMVHSKYFCKSSNAIKRKFHDEEKNNLSNKISKIVPQQQPLQLTTVTNQVNNTQKQRTVQHMKATPFLTAPATFTPNHISDQNSAFYAKYIQNFHLLLPSASSFIQNQINNAAVGHLNEEMQHQTVQSPLSSLASMYSLPSLMSALINNANKNISMNSNNYNSPFVEECKQNKQKQHHHSNQQQQQQKKSKSESPIQQQQQQQQKQTVKTNSKPQQQLQKNIELVNAALNFQSVQNWCAKCNTQFRLTSDLVYHMRTFHRRDEPTATLIQAASSKLTNKDREQKFLKCEICNENFKEKHHLTRHMTSHR